MKDLFDVAIDLTANATCENLAGGSFSGLQVAVAWRRFRETVLEMSSGKES